MLKQMSGYIQGQRRALTLKGKKKEVQKKNYKSIVEEIFKFFMLLLYPIKV